MDLINKAFLTTGIEVLRRLDEHVTKEQINKLLELANEEQAAEINRLLARRAVNDALCLNGKVKVDIVKDGKFRATVNGALIRARHEHSHFHRPEWEVKDLISGSAAFFDLDDVIACECDHFVINA